VSEKWDAFPCSATDTPQIVGTKHASKSTSHQNSSADLHH